MAFAFGLADPDHAAEPHQESEARFVIRLLAGIFIAKSEMSVPIPDCREDGNSCDQAFTAVVL